MGAVEAARLFPVTYSILAADGLLSELACYEVGTPQTCRLLHRGLNATYVFATDRDHYVGRVYGAGWRSEDSIAFELELLAHLADRGVPVCLPIPDRDGCLIRPLAAPEGTRHLVLFTYAEGTPMSWELPDHRRGVGCLVAQLHDAADDFDSARERRPLDLRYLVDESLEALLPLLDDRPAARDYLERFGNALRARAEAICDQGLDWGVCHGDVAAGNVHAVADRLTMFDFDLAAAGWRAYDLAAVQWVALNRRDQGVWDDFVRGYLDRRPLAQADLAAVPAFHAVRHLWSLGMEARCAPALGVWRLSDEYLEPELSFFRDWERAHGAEAAAQW